MQTRSFQNRQIGFTIIEMMISVLLGLMIMGTASFIYLGNRTTTATQRDLVDIAQSGSIATDIVARMFRQAGHVAISGTTGGAEGGIAAEFCSLGAVPPASPASSTPADGPFIEGWDAKTVSGGTLVNNSDLVTLRFDGSSKRDKPGEADGAVVDCLGKAVLGPTPGSTSERSWAKLYVANDSTSKNPALYCAYRNNLDTADTIQPLIDNVETFQVLYGIGALYSWDGTTKLTNRQQQYRIVIEKYLPASAITTATDWSNVAAVRFGVVIAGEGGTRGATDGKTDYDVFGAGYGSASGAQFDATKLSADRRARPRKTVSATVELRNAPIFTGCKPA